MKWVSISLLTDYVVRRYAHFHTTCCCRRKARQRRQAVSELFRTTVTYEVGEHLYGQREDDGGVLLGGDAVERLEVAQLERRRRLVDDVRRLAAGKVTVGLASMMSDASRSACAALFSPSAAITCTRNSK